MTNPTTTNPTSHVPHPTTQKGYKKTKLGYLPAEWEFCQLKSILKVKHGKSQKDVLDKNGSFPILGSGGEMGRANAFLYDKPSVLIGRKGTIDKPQFMEEPFWTVDTLFYTEINEIVAFPLWLFFQFQTINWKKYNEASSIPSLSASTISSIKIPLPPLPEQHAIANCLSTWDDGIQKLTQLIKAKEKRHKGLMQQLLTGKKRLTSPENFRDTGEWQEVRLRDVANFRNGKAHEKSIVEDGEFVVVNSKFISTSGKVRKFTGELICPLKKGEIAIVMSDIPKGKALAKCYFIEKEGAYSLNQRIGGVFADKCFGPFLYQILNRNKYYLRFDDGVSQTNLRKDEVLDCPLRMPELKEQTAIAQVLQTAANEIELLQQKLHQLQQQKKGLMQQLLTGKKRLKI